MCKHDGTEILFHTLTRGRFIENHIFVYVYVGVYVSVFFLHGEVCQCLKKSAVQGLAKCSIGVLLHFRSVATALSKTKALK